MLTLVSSQNRPFQSLETEAIPDGESPDKSSSKAACRTLKLVVSSPAPREATFPQGTFNANNMNVLASFMVEIHVKGPYLYEMRIQNPSHSLKCDLILEVEEAVEEGDVGTVICHFPIIGDEGLNRFVEEDETLHGMLMIQFQIRVLEQLLLFCATHDASELVIFADDDQAEALGIYQDFLTYKDQTMTSKGEKTEMVIPADCETFDAWVDFMDEINRKFQQCLWYDQKNNPVIKRYLKNLVG